MTKAQLSTYQKKFESEGVIVNGNLIKDKTVYKVVPKTPTSNAPDIYKYQLQSEKERLPFVSNLKTFATINGMVNNGFHAQSHVFNEMGITDYSLRESKAEEFEAIFLEPIRSIMSDEEFEAFKKPRAYEVYETDRFSDIVSVDIREGRQFNTENPMDRFHLYIAALTGGIVEKGERTPEERKQGLLSENDSRAQYAFVSEEKVLSNKENASLERIKATKNFALLFEDSKADLIDMLNFNFPLAINRTDDDDKIYVKFDANILNHFESRGRIRRFLKEYEDYKENTTQYRNMLKIYGDLLNKGADVINSHREVVLDDVVISDVKTAARRLSKEPALLKVFYSKIKQ